MPASPSSFFDISEYHQPERTAYRIEEVPEPLDPVASAVSRLHSRSGPVVEFGDGIFRPLSSGKYKLSQNNTRPDKISLSSSTSLRPRLLDELQVLKPDIVATLQPERTARSTEEALVPHDSVAIAGSSHLSRSGPVVELGDEGFHTSTPGKSLLVNHSSSNDARQCFSKQATTGNTSTMNELRIYY